MLVAGAPKGISLLSGGYGPRLGRVMMATQLQGWGRLFNWQSVMRRSLLDALLVNIDVSPCRWPDLVIGKGRKSPVRNSVRLWLF